MKKKKKKKNQLPGRLRGELHTAAVVEQLENSFKSVDVCVFFVLLADVARLQSKIKRGKQQEKRA